MTAKSNGQGALTEWKNLATFEVTLPSGIHVKARYLDMEQVLLSGEVNVAVLEGVDAKAVGAAKRRTAGSRNGKAADPAAVAEGVKYKQYVVTSSILEVSGEPVSLAMEDFFSLPKDDRDKLFRYIQRAESVPLARS